MVVAFFSFLVDVRAQFPVARRAADFINHIKLIATFLRHFDFCCHFDFQKKDSAVN